MASDAAMIEVPGPDGQTRSVRISSPGRVMWPACPEGTAPVTKLDLATYLRDVGTQMLGTLAGRPVTLQRFPDGIEGEEFYSKNPPRGVPGYARTVMMTYPSGRRHPQIVVDEVATILWTAQMNTVTLHPWSVTAPAGLTVDDDSGARRSSEPGALDRPDELRIDLDPQPGRRFADAAATARILREVMAEAGLTGFVKTSGNRGVHVFARITPEHEFLDVRHGVIAIAREVERRDPRLVTTAWWKEQRGERVFVDFNQACRDRTLASAYSARPLPGAPVSMPVRWEDLDDVDPRDFRVDNAADHVAAQHDPWAAMAHEVGSLDVALGWWERDVADGLPEKSFPPDYPKMPGEPPRVQPSRKRHDDADYEGDAGGYLRQHPPGADR